MTILKQNYKNDQTEFEKALEEAKKQMSETNKKFAQAMQEIKKIWKNQAQEYKALINAVKINKIDYSRVIMSSPCSL